MLFIKLEIQERGAKCGSRGECSLVLEDFWECYYMIILGNVQEHCGKFSGRLWGIFK